MVTAGRRRRKRPLRRLPVDSPAAARYVLHMATAARPLGRALLLLAGLALAACATPSYSEVRSEWPPSRPGTGRLVFLGDNFGWYGLFEGVSWKPTLAVDGRVLDVDNGQNVYFAVDVPAGKCIVSVDGREQLSVLVQENVTKYVEMQRVSVVNDEFSLRNTNYKLQLVQLSEAHALPRLDQYEWLGFAE